MSDKETLQELIDDLQKQLQNAQEKLENLNKNSYWIPQKNEEYWYIDSTYDVLNTYTTWCELDRGRCGAFNCFKTKKDAERERNKILIRRKLENLARRLNGNEKINWNNFSQIKYHIMYDFERACFDYVINYNYIDEGTIYCLNKNFLNEAIKEIGEQELKDYIIGE